MQPSQLRSRTSTIDIYIKLAQYPILADKIRKRMREEVFSRGIIKQEDFEAEVKQQAIESQYREGLFDPFSEEPATVWRKRKARIRAFHTDYYFAYNLPLSLFDEIVHEVVQSKHTQTELMLAFNPEIAPWEMLFRQGEIYESMAPPEREKVKHHLQEIKVVLIRGMITDQLPLIGVARKVLSIADLRRIHRRRIGDGKIGGKAAGMIIAWKILQHQSPDWGGDISEQVSIPDSFFLGTDVMYDFRRHNDLDFIMNQKYKPLEEVRSDYPVVIAAHLSAEFPEGIRDQLRLVLEKMGNRPVIVRSSSLLEDNFGSAFAGKYDSYFCPNQGTPKENLQALEEAIKRVYASTLSADALLYRQQHGLIDYDERMAILIQEVRGHQYKNFFFPTVAGVGFSQNPFRWNPKIRREDGFLRMVCGMGTRAVDRVGNDYPRLISLSHPLLRPETTSSAIRRYSQHLIDVINLEKNQFEVLPISDVIGLDYPNLAYVASLDKGGFIQQLVSIVDVEDPDDLVLTFDYLVKDGRFVRLLRNGLMRLEKLYGTPVDIEFTVEVTPTYPYPEYELYILQCRPLSQRAGGSEIVDLPTDVPEADIMFTEKRLVPDGRADGVRYVVFVDPQTYREIPNQTMKLEIGRAVGRINKALENEKFILIGPGRWGSSNLDLGVKVSYADIYNTNVLVEIGVETESGAMPELSYGTHFFQDLVEAGIHALPIHLEDEGGFIRWEFFRNARNALTDVSPQDEPLSDFLRVIDIAEIPGNRRLNVVMDGGRDEAMGYLADGEWDTPPNGNHNGTVSSF
ncbi:MAG: PEP/pyruvate-binding domain-containing protein [Anaerolineae bacterium]|nr:PEP/pyruvate-binding domain-containing protein [Anaerolineae bacterium]MCO5196427.1 PEP/pyruvate-binding domain-containing protein [Anaerolineae bacterium]